VSGSLRGYGGSDWNALLPAVPAQLRGCLASRVGEGGRRMDGACLNCTVRMSDCIFMAGWVLLARMTLAMPSRPLFLAVL